MIDRHMDSQCDTIMPRHYHVVGYKERGIIISELKIGLWYFFSAHHLTIPYICTKFHEEILNRFNRIERTRNIAGNKQRGILTSEPKEGLRFFYSAHHLIMPYIYTKFYEEILNSFNVKEWT